MRQTISGIRQGDDVREVFLVGAASLQQSRNGPYWRLELRDATGKAEAKIWAPLSAAFSDIQAGQMAAVEARAGLFRDQIQLSVSAFRPLEQEEQAALPLGDFLPASPRPAADMLAEAEALCILELSHKPWCDFALAVLEDTRIRAALLTAPAAKSIHHAYVGGLLEHMLSVSTLCLRLADHYPELDRQTLFVAALFHDIGKIDEMSAGLVTEYTDSGKLLGHIVQGLMLLEPFLAAAGRESGLEPELALHFRHLVASHHGELEFGAARVPATAEAFALHYADNLDAKIAQCRNLFPAETGEVGMAWSPWQNLLERQLCRPVRTPGTPQVTRAAPVAPAVQTPCAECAEDPAPGKPYAAEADFCPEAEPDMAPDAFSDPPPWDEVPCASGNAAPTSEPPAYPAENGASSDGAAPSSPRKRKTGAPVAPETGKPEAKPELKQDDRQCSLL